MGELSNYAENLLLDHAFSCGSNSRVYTYQSDSFYIALLTTNVAVDTITGAGLTEVANTGAYARELCNTWSWNSGGGYIYNSSDITFATATASWGAITGFAICDHASRVSGNVIGYGSLSTSKTVVTNNKPTIAAGQIQISWQTTTSAGISSYLGQALLRHLFRSTSYTPPSVVAVALATNASLSAASTGATLTEPGNGYTRIDHSNADSWTAPTTGTTDNNGQISFPTPSGSWGTINYVVVLDSATTGAGNVMFYGALDTPQEPEADDNVQIPSGDLNITLD